MSSGRVILSGTINGDVRDIVHELDPYGGGYQTSEAAAMLVNRYVGPSNLDAV